MSTTLVNFLSGATAFGFFVCRLFFLRFWRRTRDQLFMAFALAFVLLGIGQAVLGARQYPDRRARCALPLPPLGLRVDPVCNPSEEPRGFLRERAARARQALNPSEIRSCKCATRVVRAW